MSTADIIWSIIVNTLFCLSIRTLMMENMLLHFLRKPFEKRNDKKKKIPKWAYPLVWCVVCFASFWGGICFITLNGFMWRELIITCISSTFLIKIINDKMDW